MRARERKKGEGGRRRENKRKEEMEKEKWINGSGKWIGDERMGEVEGYGGMGEILWLRGEREVDRRSRKSGRREKEIHEIQGVETRGLVLEREEEEEADEGKGVWRMKGWQDRETEREGRGLQVQ